MRGEVRVTDLSGVDQLGLTSFLKSVDHSLLYVSKSYLRLLSDYLQCEIKLVVYINEDGRTQGYFPLAFCERNGMTICNSLPYYGSNGGMVVDGENAQTRDAVRSLLYNRALNLVSEKCASFTVISNPLDKEGDDWMRTNCQYNLTDKRIGQITHFSTSSENSEENLMNSFEDPRPRNIRKALKEGVTVRWSNSPEDMNFLYETHVQNISAIGGLPKEKEFFEKVFRNFAFNEFRIYVAEQEGRRIAALLLFYFNKTVEYFTPATVEQSRNVQPASLIIYRAMLDSMANGFINWNWGGTWLSQGGVYDYKKRWGTTDHPYNYYINLINPDLRQTTRSFLMENFRGFYVLPFDALENKS